MLCLPLGVLVTVNTARFLTCEATLSTETCYSHNNCTPRRKQLIRVDGDLVKPERSVTYGLEGGISPKAAKNVNKKSGQ